MISFIINATAILSTLLIMLLFFHVNYKKNSLFTTLNELFMFQKMLFNKKVSNCAGKKIIISHLLFVSFVFIYLVTEALYLSLYQLGIHQTTSTMFSTMYPEYYTGDSIVSERIASIFITFILAVIFVLIIRLIYEFIVIPIALNNKRANMYQQNVYMQQVYQQPVNTPYTQQDYAVPPNQVTNISSSEQQSELTSASSEIQFKFCSQCGTRYDASKDNCPNCGMK